MPLALHRATTRVRSEDTRLLRRATQRHCPIGLSASGDVALGLTVHQDTHSPNHALPLSGGGVRCESMTLKEAFSVPKHTSAMCVQSFDDSLNSAIHTTYRISLRSSSLREPRYPLLRVLVAFKTQLSMTCHRSRGAQNAVKTGVM